MIKQAMTRLHFKSADLNNENIVRLIRERKPLVETLCDFGAGDGIVTDIVVDRVRPRSVSVVEMWETNAEKLRRKGYEVYPGDLNGPLDILTTFDVIIANQVIEHLYDTDRFLGEMFRLTKPGGIAVVSTENLASWHNVLSLVPGWQPFSLTNVSGKKSGVGNPFALHAGEDGNNFFMQHHRLFTTRALKELMELHGFVDVAVAGAGYHPLPPALGRIDPWHAHFITVVGTHPDEIISP